MASKAVILAWFILIFFCLGRAIVCLLQGTSSVKVVKALSGRIILSVSLFLLLLLAAHLGYLHPHGAFS